MKTVGIVGGIGPESTIAYYRAIFARYRALRPDGSAPSVIIDSIDLKKMLALVAAGALEELTSYLVAATRRLGRAGADFGLLAASTPHVVFDAVRHRSRISLISAVEATCTAARDQGLTRLGLLGTRYTMQGQFYPEVFSKAGIALVVPAGQDQEYVHDKYLGELVGGIVLAETRQRLVEIVERLREQERIQGLILGGTELSLILKAGPEWRIPILDTTQIHVEQAVARLLA